ncbi:thiamine phosphate synthase [Marinilabilia rubra]|uniref:Thiamine phosphate synthase n=1 Tax=Marinilabilia rubra TaxID=2162893 RepID=A0A2U2BBM4_9BACT|nr:thiamine phosphate synthase [Marinilabilia rubra]PWE00475.1 thiamine phosphate synthase [Marinilabilia rubra]
MELYLISHEQFFEGETEIVTELLAGYDFTFHLRKPGATMDAYKGFLSRIPSEMHHKIMLHDAYPLSQEFGLKGLHFSTRNRQLRSTFRGHINSTSAHSLVEVAKLDKLFDYQFLSPVFPSISKPGYSCKLDLNAVKSYLQKPRESKIVALGGVTEISISLLQKTGFDGAAVLGKVWGNHSETDTRIHERFYKVYNSVKKAEQ